MSSRTDARGRDRIEISLDPVPDVLVPGGAPRQVEATLHNHGPEVEQVELRPVGPLAPWVGLEQPVVRIWPQQSARCVLRVQIPSGPAPAAGPTVLALAGRTGDGVRAESSVAAEVAAHVEVAVSAPEPHALESPRLAEVGVHLAHRGNVPVRVEVTAQDREGRLEQRRPRPSFTLAPGRSTVVGLGLRCRRVMWRGRARPHEYTVRADLLPADPGGSAGPESPSVTGVLLQTPLLRVWWLLLWAALLLATVLLWLDGSFLLLLVLISLTLSWSGFLLVRVLHGLFAVRTRPVSRAPAGTFPPPPGA